MITTQAARVLFWSQYADAMFAVHANECRKGNKPDVLPRVRNTGRRKDDSTADDILAAFIDPVTIARVLRSRSRTIVGITSKERNRLASRHFMRTPEGKEYRRKYYLANRDKIRSQMRARYHRQKEQTNGTTNKEL